jgi:hypothetical protein
MSLCIKSHKKSSPDIFETYGRKLGREVKTDRKRQAKAARLALYARAATATRIEPPPPPLLPLPRWRRRHLHRRTPVTEDDHAR